MLYYVTQATYNLRGFAHNLVISRPFSEAEKQSSNYNQILMIFT